MNRLVKPELLDELPPDDPRVVRSRRDLRRVNFWMRNHVIMARALQAHLIGDAPKQITELGAGDGHFLLRVAREMSPHCPGAEALLLDRQQIVSTETLTFFAKLGWNVQTIVSDVFDWSGEVPGQPAREDTRPIEAVVVANLFLHHFENQRLAKLLEAVAQRATVFVAVEPHRFRYPFLCGQLLWLIGCNAVTRYDAAVSVRAGFLRDELSALWPDKHRWQLTDRRAGLFSHLFIARRVC